MKILTKKYFTKNEAAAPIAAKWKPFAKVDCYLSGTYCCVWVLKCCYWCGSFSQTVLIVLKWQSNNEICWVLLWSERGERMWGITGDESSRHECHLGNTRGRSCDPWLAPWNPWHIFCDPWPQRWQNQCLEYSSSSSLWTMVGIPPPCFLSIYIKLLVNRIFHYSLLM